MNVDDVFIEVGDCGRYQIILATLLTIPAIFPSAFSGFSHVFVSATPDHWCKVPQLIKLGVPLHIRKNLSIPLVLQDGIYKYSRCEMYKMNYTSEFLNETWKSWNLSAADRQDCQYGWEYDNSDYDSTLVTKFDLVCDKNWLPSTAVALFYTGSLFGTLLYGWITDKYGRRTAFFSNLAFVVLLSAASAFSPNYAVYIFWRFLIGFTFPAVFQIPFIMVMELTSKRHRTSFGMIINMLWGLSMSVLSGIAALTREWFSLLLYTSLPFASLFAYWWILPESPRWLISQNRFDEAEDVFINIARINKKQIQRNLLHKYQVTDPIPRKTASVRPIELLRTPNMRKKTCLLAFIFLVNSVVYSGLSYMSANLGVSDYLAFGISGLVEAPSCLVSWYAMEKWGRRWTTIFTMFFVGLCCAGNVFVPEENTILNVLLPTMGKFGITASFAIVYIFAGELLPTVVRGNGLAVCSVVSGIGLIGFPYIIYLVVYVRVLPLLILGMMSIAGGIAALFLPETAGENLPQVMEEGEEFGKDMKIFSFFSKS